MNVLQDIIYPAIDEFNLTLPAEKQLKKSPDTILIGKNSTLDSVQLVALIIEAEELLQDHLGEEIKLVTEEAMSRQESPFHNLAGLAAYIEEVAKLRTQTA